MDGIATDAAVELGVAMAAGFAMVHDPATLDTAGRVP